MRGAPLLPRSLHKGGITGVQAPPVFWGVGRRACVAGKEVRAREEAFGATWLERRSGIRVIREKGYIKRERILYLQT